MLWPVVDPMAALYLVYARWLLAKVRRWRNDRGLSEALVDAEGVVQEAFVRMLESEKTIDNPRAWLFVVARHLVDRAARQHGRTTGDDPADHLDAGTARWTTLPPAERPDHAFAAYEVERAV
ncbi:sigma factor [Actinomadura scrupuli]|uniref:sigma factor n=1 Tax=Actinomadura scrupuli TaxID=559629 RepID=UPI003D95C5E6